MSRHRSNKNVTIMEPSPEDNELVTVVIKDLKGCRIAYAVGQAYKVSRAEYEKLKTLGVL